MPSNEQINSLQELKFQLGIVVTLSLKIVRKIDVTWI